MTLLNRCVVFALLVTCSLMLTACKDGAPKKRKRRSTGTSSGTTETADYGPAGGKVDLSSPGKIVGLAKFVGDAPAAIKQDVSKDAWCLENNPELMKQTIVVGGGGGLADAVIWLEGLDDHGDDFPEASGSVELVQRGCQYVPRILTVRTGQDFKVVNADDTSHNFHFIPWKNDEINVTQRGPKSDTFTFEKPEVDAPMTCDVHPWMDGRIHIFAHPCFAKSGAGGKFTIEGVPPGKYKVHFKHEATKPAKKSVDVTVTAGGSVDLGEITFRR